MRIKVTGYLTLKNAMGDKGVLEIEMENATLRAVLSNLCKRFGQEFSDLIFDGKTKDLSDHIRVLVNGRHYKYLPNRLDTELEEGDEVALFPPLAGG
ncbi:MAG: MoaD/ThiS family protein [Desulfobacteraceae bacterium]|nr:MAG: MoaD/ThiS family protein [Desulfobacteraceae bacterium]